MARKSWSNLFLLVAAVNLALAIAPANRFRLLAALATPMMATCAIYLRRRMI